MADPLVELHVPLTQEYAPHSSWIDQVQDQLSNLAESKGDVEEYDDGEEVDGEYLFFLTGSVEENLLAAAAHLAALPGVPPGSYAMVTDTDAEGFGLGRREGLQTP